MQEYCTLEPVSRKLTLTEPQRIAGVESDEYARGLKFKFPKIVDEIDLTQMQLRINFMNSRQEKGQYLITDVKPSDTDADFITFSWPFSRLVTKYRGLTKFVVCAIKTDPDGTITAEWNTALAQLRVFEGLEVDEPAVTPEEKDIISQLIAICQAAVVDSEASAQEAQDAADESAASAQRAKEEADKVLKYGPTIGPNGNWFIGGVDTGKPSQGETPEIGASGNWFIGGTDTGLPSRGVTPDLQMGTVTTLPAGSEATVSITGTPEEPLLNLGLPQGKDGAGGGTEEWEEIGSIPLSPDTASYELGSVDEWRKIRLMIFRDGFSSSLKGYIALQVQPRVSVFLGQSAYTIREIIVEVNNLYQFGGSYFATNNAQTGSSTETKMYTIKGNGFPVQNNNYVYKPGDKYALTALKPAECFDGTETTKLFGVRRK